jgi:hypothetical protein
MSVSTISFRKLVKPFLGRKGDDLDAPGVVAGDGH